MEESRPIPTEAKKEEPPKKIPTRKEFWGILSKYIELANNPSAGVNQLKDTGQEIYDFLEAYLGKLVAGTFARKASFLMKFATRFLEKGNLPITKFYKEFGSMIIPSFYKILSYPDIYIKAEAHHEQYFNYADPALIASLDALSIPKKINKIIDNLTAPILLNCPKKELFMVLCDWMLEEKRSTAKVIRISDIFGDLLAGLIKKRAKFVQGFLYVFGGVIKTVSSFQEPVFHESKGQAAFHKSEFRNAKIT